MIYKVMMEKLCVECNIPVKGRADKKFCDDHCRSSFYNRSKFEEKSLTKNINQILKKNRQVLAKFNLNGVTKVNRDELIATGFNLNYQTQIQHSHSAQTYIFCYEYGYVDLGGDEFLLVTKENV